MGIIDKCVPTSSTLLRTVAGEKSGLLQNLKTLTGQIAFEARAQIPTSLIEKMTSLDSFMKGTADV